MSRIGKQPIPIPSGVTVTLKQRNVTVEGPKGKLSWTHRPEVAVEINEAEKIITVTRSDDARFSRSLHGLTRSLIANMIEGCSKGFVRGMEVYGVGYGVQLQGNKLTVNCGYSHPVVFEVPPGVIVEIQTPQARGDTDPAKFTVAGPDKQAVGQLAAKIRMVRKPEPYKGKGIRYAGEYVRRKVGKAFAGTGG
ncbi:MAG: 50S ribosomal protein L6 [Planctomycetes bacterium]|nr:50S ribosomal protein L6 [Planctomycetota bacterium]